jgi:hypothetical protein
MSESTTHPKSTARKELALFLVLFFTGLVVLPILIYVVGSALFGEYSGSGFSDFYQMLHGELRDGEPVVWFLMLSPYIAWQLLRLTIFGFRRAGKSL